MLKKYTITVLLLLMAIMLNGCNNENSDPATVAKNFYQAIIEKDSDKLYEILYKGSDDILSNQMMSKSVMDGKLNMIITKSSNRIEMKGGVKSIDVLEVETKDDNAIVTIKIFYNNETNETNYVTLHKTEKGWKVTLR